MPRNRSYPRDRGHPPKLVLYPSGVKCLKSLALPRLVLLYQPLTNGLQYILSMKTEKFLIAGGNPTLLVRDCPLDEQVAISRRLLAAGDAEQVAFITDQHGITYLMMMGDELCINATLALAAISGKSGQFFTRGIDSLVSYTNTDWTTIELQLPFKQDGNIILFDGIGYACYTNEVIVTKEKIIDLAKQYKLPAFGVIECKGNTMTPHVYVVETGSLIDESACGSGSIAASIVLKSEDIIQPSGETIKVKRSNDRFTVSAQVKLLPVYASDLGLDTGHSQYAVNDGSKNVA